MKACFRLPLAVFAAGAIGAAPILGIHAQTKPPAYLVQEIEVTDPVGWKQYTDAARPLILSMGGQIVTAGGKTVSVAGDPPKRITIFKFESIEKAQAYESSAAYTALKANRDKSSRFRAYIVEALVPN